MFDMIGVAPICVRADREVQGSICERLTLPDNPLRTSGPIEVLHKIFPPILMRGKSGLNRAKNPVSQALGVCENVYLSPSRCNPGAQEPKPKGILCFYN